VGDKWEIKIQWVYTIQCKEMSSLKGENLSAGRWWIIKDKDRLSFKHYTIGLISVILFDFLSYDKYKNNISDFYMWAEMKKCLLFVPVLSRG